MSQDPRSRGIIWQELDDLREHMKPLRETPQEAEREETQAVYPRPLTSLVLHTPTSCTAASRSP